MALLDEQPLLVWLQGNPQAVVWAMHRVNGMRVQLSEANVRSEEPVVATSADRAIAAWTQYYGTTPRIMSSRFTLNGGWTTPERVSDETSAARTPSVAIDDSGHAVVAWEQVVPEGNAVIVRHYTEEHGWAAPEQLSYGALPSGAIPLAMLEPGGNGFVSWIAVREEAGERRNGADSVRILRSTGWRPERGSGFGHYGQMPGGTVLYMRGGMDQSGRALVAWFDDAGMRTARFE